MPRKKPKNPQDPRHQLPRDRRLSGEKLAKENPVFFPSFPGFRDKYSLHEFSIESVQSSFAKIALHSTYLGLSWNTFPAGRNSPEAGPANLRDEEETNGEDRFAIQLERVPSDLQFMIFTSCVGFFVHSNLGNCAECEFYLDTQRHFYPPKLEIMLFFFQSWEMCYIWITYM